LYNNSFPQMSNFWKTTNLFFLFQINIQLLDYFTNVVMREVILIFVNLFKINNLKQLICILRLFQERFTYIWKYFKEMRLLLFPVKNFIIFRFLDFPFVFLSTVNNHFWFRLFPRWHLRRNWGFSTPHVWINLISGHFSFTFTVLFYLFSNW
jgi:hypothetical protein